MSKYKDVKCIPLGRLILYMTGATLSPSSVWTHCRSAVSGVVATESTKHNKTNQNYRKKWNKRKSTYPCFTVDVDPLDLEYKFKNDFVENLK